MPNFREKEKCRECQCQYRKNMVYPNAGSASQHPTGIFSTGSFADNGQHSDKAGKKKESLCRREKSKTLIKIMGNGSGKMIQNHLQ